MTDPKIFVLIGLVSLLSFSSASSSYFVYPGNFPIVYFADFKYIPTDYGYLLSYRTQAGVTHEELGIVPGTPSFGNGNDNSNNDSSNPDTLGSSREGREKSKKLPFKSRKVSPKLLASLSG